MTYSKSGEGREFAEFLRIIYNTIMKLLLQQCAEQHFLLTTGDGGSFKFVCLGDCGITNFEHL
jgi:hypothetical protein